MSETERQGWKIVASLFVVSLVLVGGGFLTFTVFFEPLVESFGWSYVQTSLLVTVLMVMTAVFSPLAGWLLERIQAQWLISVGAVAMVAGFVTASHATSYAPMIGAYALLGLGLALSTIVPGQVVTANWFDNRRRGTAIAVVASGAAAGGFVMILAAAHAVSAWGWRDAYLALAAPVILVVLPLVLMFVRTRPEGTTGYSVTEAVGVSFRGLGIGEAFGTHSFWLIMLIYFAYGFAVAITLTHGVPILIGLGYTPDAAASVLEEAQIVTVMGTIVMGMLGDRIGGRAALSVCFVFAALSFLTLANAAQPVWRIAFIVTFGLSGPAPVALLALLLIHTMGLKHFGFFSGLGSFLYTIGMAVGPLAAGRIFDVTRSYSNALVTGGLLSLAIAALVLAVTVAPALRQGESVAAVEL